MSNEVVFGEWQLCPKCNGRGWVFPEYISTGVTEECDVCQGAKLIQRPIISPATETSANPENKKV